MHKFTKILFIFIFLSECVFASDYRYILHDPCINTLYNDAYIYFKDSDIEVLRIPQGILLRFKLNKYDTDNLCLSSDTQKIIRNLEKFLAKIENPAIIEVHAGDISGIGHGRLKSWEISSVIANQIETELINTERRIETHRLHSVGYGEFLPPKNTPYNGGNYLNRVDIIILCNIIGD